MKSAVAARMAPTTSRSRPGRGRSQLQGRARAPLHGQPLLRPGAGQQQDHDAGHLQDGQRRGRGQVEQDGRLAVDLDLQRRVPRATQQQDDAEGGDREEEDDGGRRDDRRPQERPGDLAEGAPRRGAQHARGLLGPRVEVLPDAAHEAHDDGHVVEDVGDDDGGCRAVQADLGDVRAAAAAVARASSGLRGPSRARKADPDDDRGQHEGHDREGPGHAPAREVEAGEDPGHGQAQEHRQERGDGRQAEREEHDVERRRAAARRRRRCPAAGSPSGATPRARMLATGHRKKRPTKASGGAASSRARRPRHRSTMSVHWRIQSSRPAAMASGPRLSGACGRRACRVNTSGRATSERAG